MFLVAITKDEISQNFQNIKLEELNIHPFLITVITDDFLSKYIPEENGFSVIESPLLQYSNFKDIIFSRITFNKNDNSFIILRSIISGRPIYYTINSKGDFYCSTHISMLRNAGVQIEENPSVLPEFFIYRHVMPPKTLYKNIKRLLSGGQLQIGLKNDKCSVHSIYKYTLPKKNQQIKSIVNSSVEAYGYLLESIKRLDTGKDEIAILLSGGIDSSIISTICKDIFAINKSYSTGYPFEPSRLNIEKRYALSAAEAFGMNHHYYEPNSREYLSGLIEAISLAEEPVHHLQSVLLHLLWKNEIPKNEKIVLCGQGRGTTFGDNNFFYINENKDKVIFRLLSTKPSIHLLDIVSKLMGRGEELIDIMKKSNCGYPLSNPENPIWSWMAHGSKNWVCNYFNVTEEDIVRERCNFINEFSNMSIYDIWSLYSLFGDEDVTLSILSKIGEGNKRIIYFPFYDLNLLDYVFSIPWSLKLRKYNILAKEIARQSKLPEFIINRPKSSFGIHSRQWPEKGGTFEPLIPLASKVFDEKEIRKLQSSNPKKAMTFWNILNYSIWKRLCINNEPLEVLLEELR